MLIKAMPLPIAMNIDLGRVSQFRNICFTLEKFCLAIGVDEFILFFPV